MLLRRFYVQENDKGLLTTMRVFTIKLANFCSPGAFKEEEPRIENRDPAHGYCSQRGTVNKEAYAQYHELKRAYELEYITSFPCIIPNSLH